MPVPGSGNSYRPHGRLRASRSCCPCPPSPSCQWMHSYFAALKYLSDKSPCFPHLFPDYNTSAHDGCPSDRPQKSDISRLNPACRWSDPYDLSGMSYPRTCADLQTSNRLSCYVRKAPSDNHQNLWRFQRKTVFLYRFIT